MNEKKYLYRWVILLSSFLIMATASSIVNAIHTLFVTPVTESKGFTLSAFSLIFTLSAIVIAFTSPIIGKLLQLFSIRWIMSTGAALVGFGFICYSFANTITTFYIIGISVAVGMALLTLIPISTMITHWFRDSQGTALGIAFAGGGAGTFLWMQIVSRILQNYGYAYAYLLLGIIILAITLPIALFLVVKSPEDKYNLPRIKENVSAESHKKSSIARLLKNSSFVSFASGLLLMGISIAGIQIHLQSYLMSIGYELSYNANVGSILAISGLLANILGGMIFDKFRTQTALGFFGACALTAILLLLFAQYRGVPYIFAVVFGACLCLPSLWPSYGVGKIFQHEDYASTLGVANLFFVIGGALGPFFSGLMADSAFGYKAAWTVYFFLTCIYLFLFRRSLRML